MSVKMSKINLVMRDFFNLPLQRSNSSVIDGAGLPLALTVTVAGHVVEAINAYDSNQELIASQAEELKMCNIEASSLATYLYKKYWANLPNDVGFELLDTPSGIMTQIDNMTCGMGETIAKQQADIELLASKFDKLVSCKISCDGLLMVGTDKYNELVGLFNGALAATKGEEG